MISEPQWSHNATYNDAPHFPGPPYVIECPTCGYEPPDQQSIHPGRCPRCHAFTWHRVLIAGRLTEHDAEPVDDA